MPEKKEFQVERQQARQFCQPSVESMFDRLQEGSDSPENIIQALIQQVAEDPSCYSYIETIYFTLKMIQTGQSYPGIQNPDAIAQTIIQRVISEIDNGLPAIKTCLPRSNKMIYRDGDIEKEVFAGDGRTAEEYHTHMRTRVDASIAFAKQRPTRMMNPLTGAIEQLDWEAHLDNFVPVEFDRARSSLLPFGVKSPESETMFHWMLSSEKNVVKTWPVTTTTLATGESASYFAQVPTRAPIVAFHELIKCPDPDIATAFQSLLAASNQGRFNEMFVESIHAFPLGTKPYDTMVRALLSSPLPKNRQELEKICTFRQNDRALAIKIFQAQYKIGQNLINHLFQLGKDISPQEVQDLHSLLERCDIATASRFAEVIFDTITNPQHTIEIFSQGTSQDEQMLRDLGNRIGAESRKLHSPFKYIEPNGRAVVALLGSKRNIAHSQGQKSFGELPACQMLIETILRNVDASDYDTHQATLYLKALDQKYGSRDATKAALGKFDTLIDAIGDAATHSKEIHASPTRPRSFRDAHTEIQVDIVEPSRLIDYGVKHITYFIDRLESGGYRVEFFLDITGDEGLRPAGIIDVDGNIQLMMNLDAHPGFKVYLQEAIMCLFDDLSTIHVVEANISASPQTTSDVVDSDLTIETEEQSPNQSPIYNQPRQQPQHTLPLTAPASRISTTTTAVETAISTSRKSALHTRKEAVTHSRNLPHADMLIWVLNGLTIPDLDVDTQNTLIGWAHELFNLLHQSSPKKLEKEVPSLLKEFGYQGEKRYIIPPLARERLGIPEGTVFSRTRAKGVREGDFYYINWVEGLPTYPTRKAQRFTTKPTRRKHAPQSSLARFEENVHAAQEVSESPS